MCVCLRGCVSAYFSPHMGVIWSFVIPCLHTHTLLVLLHFVVFLFVWTKCSLARANTWSVFFFFVLFFFFSSPRSSHQAYYPLYPSCLVLSLWQTVPDLISCSILSLIGRSILLNVGVSASPDVNMLRGTEVKRGHR